MTSRSGRSALTLEPLEPPDRYIPVPPSFDPNDVYWKTREGEVMAVVDMTDSHMENCMRMMLRQADDIMDRFWIGEIDWAEANLSPNSAAMDSFDDITADVARMKPTEFIRRHYPPFVAMHNELRARKAAELRPGKTHEEYMDEVYADITERDHQFGHGPF